MKISEEKKNDMFNIVAQKIDYGNTLEPVLTSTHNLCFGAKIKKHKLPM